MRKIMTIYVKVFLLLAAFIFVSAGTMIAEDSDFSIVIGYNDNTDLPAVEYFYDSTNGMPLPAMAFNYYNKVVPMLHASRWIFDDGTICEVSLMPDPIDVFPPVNYSAFPLKVITTNGNVYWYEGTYNGFSNVAIEKKVDGTWNAYTFDPTHPEDLFTPNTTAWTSIGPVTDPDRFALPECKLHTVSGWEQAKVFDGINDKITGDIVDMPLANFARTVSAWVKISDTEGQSKAIFDYGATSPSGNFYLFVDGDGKACVGSSAEGGTVNSGSVIVDDNEWHFITGVYEGPGTDMARIYVDGVEKGSGVITPPQTADGTFEIGGLLSGGGYIGGVIDEVSLYESALTPEEVQFLMNTGSVEGAILAAYYSFNGTADDSSGNNNHGTIDGAIAISSLADLKTWPQNNVDIALIYLDITDSYYDSGNLRCQKSGDWIWYFRDEDFYGSQPQGRLLWSYNPVNDQYGVYQYFDDISDNVKSALWHHPASNESYAYTFYDEEWDDQSKCDGLLSCGIKSGRVYSFSGSDSDLFIRNCIYHAYVSGTSKPLIERDLNIGETLGAGTTYYFYSADPTRRYAYTELDNGMSAETEFSDSGIRPKKVTYTDGLTHWFLWGDNTVNGQTHTNIVIEKTSDGIWNAYYGFNANTQNFEDLMSDSEWIQFASNMPEPDSFLRPELGDWEEYCARNNITVEYPLLLPSDYTYETSGLQRVLTRTDHNDYLDVRYEYQWNNTSVRELTYYVKGVNSVLVSNTTYNNQSGSDYDLSHKSSWTVQNIYSYYSDSGYLKSVYSNYGTSGSRQVFKNEDYYDYGRAQQADRVQGRTARYEYIFEDGVNFGDFEYDGDTLNVKATTTTLRENGVIVEGGRLETLYYDEILIPTPQVAFDSHGNKIIAVAFRDCNAYVVKYDVAGQFQWSRTIPTGSWGSVGAVVTTDSSDNIYLAFNKYVTNANDVFVYKYDPSGTLLGTYQYATPESEWISSVNVDLSGNIFISGSKSMSPNSDLFIVKIRPDFTKAWDDTYNSGFNDWRGYTTFDSDGNVVLHGTCYDSDGSHPDVYKVMYDSNGNAGGAVYDGEGDFDAWQNGAWISGREYKRTSIKGGVSTDWDYYGFRQNTGQSLVVYGVPNFPLIPSSYGNMLGFGFLDVNIGEITNFFAIFDNGMRGESEIVQGENAGVKVTKTYNIPEDDSTYWFLWGDNVYEGQSNVVIKKTAAGVWTAHKFIPNTQDIGQLMQGWTLIGPVADPASLVLPELGSWSNWCVDNGIMPEFPPLSSVTNPDGSRTDYNPFMNTTYIHREDGTLYQAVYKHPDDASTWMTVEYYEDGKTVHNQQIADMNPDKPGDYVYIDYDAQGRIIRKDLDTGESYYNIGLYFPLAQTDAWTYTGENPGTFSINGTRVIDGVTTVCRNSSYDGSTSYLTMDSSGLTWYGITTVYEGQNFDSIFPVPVVWYPEYIVVGQTYTFGSTDEGYTYTSLTIDGFEDVTVNGVLFKNALKTSQIQERHIEGQTFVDSSAVWYVNNLGFVKDCIYSGDQMTFSIQSAVTHYADGLKMAELLSAPDPSGFVYYEYLDENYNAQGFGRVSKEQRADGSYQLIQYWNDTGTVISIKEYYASGRLESETLTSPDEEGNTYYHYIDENWANQGYGRMDKRVSATTAADDAIAYSYDYIISYGDYYASHLVYRTGLFKHEYRYANTDFTGLLATYEYGYLGNYGPEILGVKDDFVMDFGSEGLMKYKNGVWTQINEWDPVMIFGGNLDNFIVDFGPTHGLWQYDNVEWSQITTRSPQRPAYWTGDISAGDFEIFGWFGIDGFCRLTEDGLTQLSPIEPENEWGVNNELYLLDFGSQGLWSYNYGSGELEQVTSMNAAGFMSIFFQSSPTPPFTMTSVTLIDFDDYGLWKYVDGQLSRISEKNMYDFNCWPMGMSDRVIIDFDLTGGLWLYDYSEDSWLQISESGRAHWAEPVNWTDPDNDEFFIDFREAGGFYKYADGELAQISPWNCYGRFGTSADGGTIFDFGRDHGLWEYDDGQLSPYLSMPFTSSDNDGPPWSGLACGAYRGPDGAIYAQGDGFWKYVDGAWTQLWEFGSIWSSGGRMFSQSDPDYMLYDFGAKGLYEYKNGEFNQLYEKSPFQNNYGPDSALTYLYKKTTEDGTYEYDAYGNLLSTCTYYATGKLESKTLSQPDVSDNIYYHYIDEDWALQGCGRVDKKISASTDADGAQAYTYEYETKLTISSHGRGFGFIVEKAEDVRYQYSYANTDFTNLVAKYVVDDNGDIIAGSPNMVGPRLIGIDPVYLPRESSPVVPLSVMLNRDTAARIELQSTIQQPGTTNGVTYSAEMASQSKALEVRL